MTDATGKSPFLSQPIAWEYIEMNVDPLYSSVVITRKKWLCNMFPAQQQITLCSPFFFFKILIKRIFFLKASLENIHQRRLKGRNATTEYSFNLHCYCTVPNINNQYHKGHKPLVWGEKYLYPKHKVETNYKVLYKKVCTEWEWESVCMCVIRHQGFLANISAHIR